VWQAAQCSQPLTVLIEGLPDNMASDAEDPAAKQLLPQQCCVAAAVLGMRFCTRCRPTEGGKTRTDSVLR